jgi:protein-S-isoprenylcysteine O-methyltransferase Ste14
MNSQALVLAQFACLAALVVPLPGGPMLHPIGVVIAACGGVIGVWSLAANRPGNFNVRPEPKAGGRLVTTGPYRFVRHPMYLAVLFFGGGMATAYGEYWRWGVFVVLALVLDRKAAREEHALRETFAAYDDYAARTGRFLPRWR